MKIVVTGASGFIGSGVLRYLNDQGYRDLIAVDYINIHKVDFVSAKELFSWLDGRESEIQAIIHLGACSDTLESNRDYLLENNTSYTRRLAEYALKHSIRFIYASSAATYGDGSRGFSDDHTLLETLKPLNLYGESKHLFDLWAKKEGVLDHIVGLKYFNVFGPNEGHKGRMASMVYKMVPVVQKEGVVRLYKSSEPNRFPDGGQCRDFIYVKDAVRMTCDFLKDNRGGIFNVGLGRPTTWNQLATAIFKALGKTPVIEYIDMPSDLVGQYQNYTCADMTKWNPLNLDYTIEKAVEDYIHNHLLQAMRW
jgi:ADP-L-glycero-D-manno-heptose 6-epimerase